MNLINSWKLFALASAVFAALTAIFGKLGVSTVDSNFATFVRTVVILVFITGILYFSDFKISEVKNLEMKQVLFLIVSGLCTGISWLCYYHALKLGPASQVAPIDKLGVALAILMVWIFLGEKMSWGLALGSLLIISGTLIILIKA